MPWGTKNMPPKKNLSRGSLSNWCDVDADADISKTICPPPPYGGVDIITEWQNNTSKSKASHNAITNFFDNQNTKISLVLTLGDAAI